MESSAKSRAKNTGKAPPATPIKIGFWHMVRDVCLAALNKGQLLIAMVGMIILVTVYRLPPSELAVLMRETKNDLVSGKLLGWILFFAVIFAWCGINMRVRKHYRDEVRRIGAEKSLLQKKALGADAPSTTE